MIYGLLLWERWCNIGSRIGSGQRRHKITIYGNVLSVYIHIWQIRDVTNRLLFTRRYYWEGDQLALSSHYQWSIARQQPRIGLPPIICGVILLSSSCLEFWIIFISIYIIFYLMFCGIVWKFSYFYFTFVMDLTVLETCFLLSVSNC